uniref:JmjC domain-containing protein n=1 Tax=Kwoniella bestiolae CBS 10118 TaxID=1296100 RepID=A0A1B9FZW6_9TREE|nr:hypothetical protein I302_05775 [Kwoniella bestiolae CBS 10118]OCF24316.1 hypothetical protein I302_05775 [Kwoniella bestiolae CBS 10118]
MAQSARSSTIWRDSVPFSILSQLAAELIDRNVEETQDTLLNHANPAITSRGEEKDTILLNLQTLETLSHEMINSIPFNIVPRHWLRLYTDIALLRSIRDIVIDEEVHESNMKRFWLDAVRRLDMAIIVAGALGNNRKNWILDLIRVIQEKLSSQDTGNIDVPTKAKRRKIDTTPSHTPLLFAPNPILVLDHFPSVEEYLQDHLSHPFILRGYLKGSASSPAWPACSRWSSADYLLRTVGPGRVIPVEIGKAYDDIDWSQQIIPFTEFLHRAGFKSDARDKIASTPDESSPLYLAQYALFDQVPELEKDISFPDYVWSNPPAPGDTPSYTPPQNNDGLIVNVWVGSGNNEIISPAHTVVGYKRVWLAPPSCGLHMYAYGDGAGESDGIAYQYMTNTSKVPILKPIDDFKQLQTSYPEFFDRVWPESLEAILEPGDMMVMPPGWWHAMRAEGAGPAWSVSMWY